MDAKIGIPNDLTLDLTINPDFGQVDADPGAIALDGFEMFVKERRPFFIENKNVLDFRVDEDTDGNDDYSFGNPDFAFVQFRLNLVAPWEYIPGSEIFLVWSQGVDGFGDVNNSFADIVDNQLFSQKPQNTFLIKATYRFVLEN